MELRSSRSRSRTPFLQSSLQNQGFVEGSQVEETIVRTTRSTTVKSFENVSSSSLNSSVSSQSNRALKSKTGKSDKSVRKTRYKTSDYSSEEGEGEVTSSRVITENDKNQLIEDARSAANGSAEVSALGLYRKAGRYWDVYPKTDWTYSRHSRDRVELAPGVVAMPNMSRRSLHSQERSTEHLLSHHKDTVDHSYSNYVGKSHKYQPRTLFTNNNHDDDYEHVVSSYKRNTWISRVVRVFTSVFSVFYFFFEVQRRSMLWVGKKVHKAASLLMLWDTWLLRRQPRDKLPAILLLCLLPLLFFGGWYLMSTLGYSIYGAFANTSTSTRIYEEPVIVPMIDHGRDRRDVEEKIIKVTEKVIIEPPTAGEIAAELTPEQLEKIAALLKNSFNVEEQRNTDLIVEKVLQSPDVQNIVNNYHYNVENNQDTINNEGQTIDSLRAEINQMKLRNEDISKRLLHYQSQNNQKYARLHQEMTRCCRKSYINVEAYVAKAVKDYFATSDRDELMRYLQSLFVAKQDLETHLANVTQHLQSNLDSSIEHTGQRVMEEVSLKIAAEIKKNVGKYQSTGNDVAEGGFAVTDEHIRGIVKDVLSIYDADKTGLVDYAMEPMGGQIMSTKCTESYRAGTAVLSIFGIPLYYPTASPRTVITPGINPGECWAFQNFPGFLTIKLARPVYIEAFSYEHISRKLIANGKIDSAPKEFEVYGLRNETDQQPVKIAHFKYDFDGEPLQFFSADNRGLVFEMIELRVLSNHGNPNYTCLYRFRVHGSVSKEPT